MLQLRLAHSTTLLDAAMQLVPLPDDTIEGAGTAIRSGKLTCRQLLENCLDRIDRLDGELKAWVLVDRDGALARARELDEEIRAGRCRGPLHGIPVGIKDIIDAAGWPTAAGSPLLTGNVAARDAPVVTKLRAAGAIILGKTITTQFAAFDPPATRNPWHHEHTPGGSSSGSAAAVATGMCLGALGSQTGGSITRPAAYCGVAGCKPTYGRVSLDGIVPLAPSLDHPGPIARCVRDLALLLQAISEPGRKGGNLCVERERPPRLGRVRGLFDERAEPPALEILEQGLAALCAAGASIQDATLPPSFDDVLPCHRVVMATEAAQYHKPRFRRHSDDYQPRIRSLVEEGLGIPAAEYERCRRHQEQFKREIPSAFKEVDALVSLAAPGPAPDRSTTGDPVFNSPWSYTGLPTVSFPLGLAPNGLPLGIQFIGRADGEPELFAVASWCERVLRSGPSTAGAAESSP